jgi:hypothetical protein
LEGCLYVAVNAEGDFLCLVDDKREIANPPRRLKAISVDYGLKYKAIVDGVDLSGKYTVLKLSALHSELLLSFCSLLSLLSSSLGPNPSPMHLQHFVEDFIELFSPKAGDPRERIKGLFGELSIIKASQRRQDFIEAWHDNANSNKDFSFPNSFLEIKTSEGKIRKHEFSASQLQSPYEGKQVLVGSILIEEDPQGETVFQLLGYIQHGLDHSLQVKLIRLVFDTLGLDAEEAHEIKWSVSGGLQGIWIVAASDLPTPHVDESDPKRAAISNVSFSLNFEILAAAGVGYGLLPEVESVLHQSD